MRGVNSEPRRADKSCPERHLLRLNDYYEAARRRAWDVAELGWDRYAPVPQAEVERWNLVWGSIVQQQLQADRFAIEAATDLLLAVEHREAILYYSTMVQDEARHVEGWTRLTQELLPVECNDPYLAEMGNMLLEGETLEERVIAFQVVFEGIAIQSFRDIASATEQTVLGEMASRLVRDDSIHHNSGVAYANYLLSDASPSLLRHIDSALKRYVPLYIEHIKWRPEPRKWLSRFMHERDEQTLRRNKRLITRSLVELGLSSPFDE